jgi:hypothetical protein
LLQLFYDVVIILPWWLISLFYVSLIGIILVVYIEWRLWIFLFAKFLWSFTFSILFLFFSLILWILLFIHFYYKKHDVETKDLTITNESMQIIVNMDEPCISKLMTKEVNIEWKPFWSVQFVKLQKNQRFYTP